MFTTTAALEGEEAEEVPDEGPAGTECEPSPSPRPALPALPPPPVTPAEDSFTNLDSQYYRYSSD